MRKAKSKSTAQARARSNSKPSTEEHRVVLDEDVTPEAFRRGAERRRWRLLREIPERADGPLELVYAPADKDDTRIHYVEDPFIKVRYVVIRGPDLRRQRSLLETTFDAYDDEEVLDRAEHPADLQEMVDWLMSATALRTQAGRARLRKLVELRLRHGNAGVRRAALLASSWLAWPELEQPIRALLEDPDPDVRRDAEDLARAYERHRGEA